MNFLTVKGVPIVAGADPTNKNPPEQRLVHLDLKGAPPKVITIFQLFFFIWVSIEEDLLLIL